jgi:hypothetical protein
VNVRALWASVVWCRLGLPAMALVVVFAAAPAGSETIRIDPSADPAAFVNDPATVSDTVLGASATEWSVDTGSLQAGLNCFGCVFPDFSITMTDGQSSYHPGQTVTYTIVASAVAGGGRARVADSFPAAFEGVTWTCRASAGSRCYCASGAGNIGAGVALLDGGTATFLATGTVSLSAVGTLTNTATIRVATSDVTDPNPGNNTATDTDISATPIVLQKVNGEHPSPPFVNTTGPYALTLDMPATTYSASLNWYWTLVVNGEVFWITTTGMSATPAPLFSSAPMVLNDLSLLNTSLPVGTNITSVFLLLNEAGVVSSDYITTTVVP